ncbi:hypothetical protein NCAS_0D04140 [Naumovozyma castellii]|uniref:Alpha-1,3/1,6-mannosyltransferase ALG2 n=1 Tax=Naumovozyma castellii TaxID=27288 RepID=G0VEK4_NAUCA|nr:hypothetical protein NCAS_0D04140 [Naumovozyma castellii CBS 4309]CCC69995.1 hypothetical protein NCAS_0D04140 [Naumovozyma castellii CBS 4309]
MATEPNKKLSIAFIHPDLGIGGAERLVVDAALGLQEQGNEVIFYTSHCDKNHCFEEIKDGTLKFQVIGDQLPTTLGGKFYIVFANLRQLYLTFKLLFTKEAKKHDVFIVDQLSTCVPFLHKYTTADILFYCHFPDQLLASRTNIIKKLYRVPFDLLEQFTISAADMVVVNSNFTKSMYYSAFNLLQNEPDVVYPCVDLDFSPIDQRDKQLLGHLLAPNDKFYLSINRYELKKNIVLALKAFALSNEFSNDNAKLIICGGYDERVSENVQCLKQLQREAECLKISYSTINYPEFEKNNDLDLFNTTHSKVIFLTSISTSLKELLLSKTELLLYTPSNEHFGIVPLEAMKHGKPVLATTSGGPLETVETLIPGKNDNIATGWLRAPIPEVWAKVIDESKRYKEGGKSKFENSGPSRVSRIFSRRTMTRSLEDIIDKMLWRKRTVYPWETVIGPFFNLMLQFIFTKLFPGSNWPYILLATVALLMKDYMSLIYWVFAYSTLNFFIE